MICWWPVFAAMILIWFQLQYGFDMVSVVIFDGDQNCDVCFFDVLVVFLKAS
jgi:hypothetical protein